jgi:hypothetical protein
MLYSSEER